VRKMRVIKLVTKDKKTWTLQVKLSWPKLKHLGDRDAKVEKIFLRPHTNPSMASEPKEKTTRDFNGIKVKGNTLITAKEKLLLSYFTTGNKFVYGCKEYEIQDVL
jgi:hypothetical protein